MKKYILLLILPIFLFPAICGLPSQENFYSAGSDFIVIQNPENTIAAPPQIYVLYPNTVISFDINNDGAYDYSFPASSGGPYAFITNWQISDGTRMHSNKPIQYVQQIYLSTSSAAYPTKTFKEDRLLTVPPIQNWRKDYLLKNGIWYVLSDQSLNISVDTLADGNIDSAFFLNKTTKLLNLTKITRLSSDNKFIAYSSNGISGVLSKDFLTNENKVYIVVAQNDTRVSFDYNIDGTPDAESVLNNGEYNFTLPKPSRITSNKNISAFGYVDGLTGFTIHTKSYFQLPMANSVSNEIIAGVNNDFTWATDKGHSLIGVFNNDSAGNMKFGFELYDLASNKVGEYTNFTTGKTQTLGLSNGGFLVNSSLPLIDSAYYYYNSGSYIRYYIGHTIAYKSIYMTTTPKSKNIIKDSNVVFNLRVFNPFKDTTARNVIIKFPINNAFSMPIASINGRKASLIDDSVISTFTKAVTLANDGSESYFLFNHEGTLEGETYLDLDFSLATPSATGVNIFPSATLTYTSPTWII